MSATNRRKGHQWERDVANHLKDIDPTAKRLLEYQQGFGIDIDTKLPLSIQCKCGKQLSAGLVGLKQAISSKKENSYPVCALKILKQGEYALLHWNDFLEMFRGYWGSR